MFPTSDHADCYRMIWKQGRERELLCCDKETLLLVSFYVFHSRKHLLAELYPIIQKGEPTHMHKHSDACGVMQDNSGFADSLLTTGMWVHTNTHTEWGWQVWRSTACYSCSQRSQAAASQGDEGKKGVKKQLWEETGHSEEEDTCCDPEAC